MTKRIFAFGLAFLAVAAFIVAPVALAAETGGPLNGIESFFGGIFSWAGGIVGKGAFAAVAYALSLPLYAFSVVLNFFVILSVWIFEFTMQAFVLNMGQWVTGERAAGVREAWIILRDIANIGIVVGLIATAVGTIINSGTWNVNKNLARLIVAALLVNFSYFFAGVIIDAANFTTNVIYKQMVQGPGCRGVAFGTAADQMVPDEDCTIANRFINIVNPLSFERFLRVTTGGPSAVAAGGIEAWNQAWSGNFDIFTNAATGAFNYQMTILIEVIMTLVFQFVAMWVFLSAVSMLVARYVALILLLVTSPIGIAGGAIPIMKQYADEWWKAIISQAIFAPLYVLIASLSLRIIELSVNDQGFLGNIFAGLGDSGTSVNLMGTAITYMIATAFMVAALRVAKNLSERAKWFSEVYKYSDQFLNWSKPIIGAAWRTDLGSIPFFGYRIPIAGPGALFERAKYAYEKIAPKIAEGRVPFPGLKNGLKVMPEALGKSLDRTIAHQIERGRAAKPFGAQSYEEYKKEKYARTAEVDSIANRVTRVKEAEDALHDYKGAHQDYLEKRKEGWEKPGEKDTEAAKNLGGDREKIAKFNDGRGQYARQWVYDDETGEWGWESRYKYDERIKHIKDKNGKDYYDHYNLSKDALRDLSPGAAMELFQEDPELLVQLAPAFTPDQFNEVMGSKEVPRKLKRRMREARYETQIDLAQEGGYVKGDWKSAPGWNKEMARIDEEAAKKKDDPDARARLRREWHDKNGGRVIKLEVWEKMSQGDRDAAKAKGFIGEFTDEWYDARGYMHETFKRQMDGNETMDLVTSTSGVNHGLQDNQMFLDAITNGNKMNLQNSEKLGAGNRRTMRGLYRKRYNSARELDNEATRDLDEAEKKGGRKYSGSERDAMAAASPYSDAEFDAYIQELERTGADPETIKTLRDGRALLGSASDAVKDAIARRAEADKRAGRWFQGKSPEEVNSEIKQEHIGSRVVARHIDKNQLRVLNKDQAFMTQLRDAILVHGNNTGAQEWMATNPEGQSKYGIPGDKELEDINKRRIGLGLEPLKKVETPEGGIVLKPRGAPDSPSGEGGGGGGAPAPKPSGGGSSGGGGGTPSASTGAGPGDSRDGPRPQFPPRGTGGLGGVASATVSGGGENAAEPEVTVVRQAAAGGAAPKPAPQIVRLILETGKPPEQKRKDLRDIIEHLAPADVAEQVAASGPEIDDELAAGIDWSHLQAILRNRDIDGARRADLVKKVNGANSTMFKNLDWQDVEKLLDSENLPPSVRRNLANILAASDNKAVSDSAQSYIKKHSFTS